MLVSVSVSANTRNFRAVIRFIRIGGISATLLIVPQRGLNTFALYLISKSDRKLERRVSFKGTQVHLSRFSHRNCSVWCAVHLAGVARKN